MPTLIKVHNSRNDKSFIINADNIESIHPCYKQIDGPEIGCEVIMLNKSTYELLELTGELVEMIETEQNQRVINTRSY